MEYNNRQITKEFWRYARPNQTAFLASFLIMIVTLVLDLVRPFLLKSGLDKIQAKDIDGLQWVATMFLIVLLLNYVSRCGFNYLLSVSFLKTIYRLRIDLFRHVLSLKKGFFDKNSGW